MRATQANGGGRLANTPKDAVLRSNVVVWAVYPGNPGSSEILGQNVTMEIKDLLHAVEEIRPIIAMIATNAAYAA